MNRNSTLWSSLAITSPIVKIYFIGDSGYGKHLKEIGESHGPFDISLIDCGQYNNAWKHSHMFPHEAVIAAKDLRSEFSCLFIGEASRLLCTLGMSPLKNQ